jgi:ribosomal-protein-alanine N-acetyltransferase
MLRWVMSACRELGMQRMLLEVRASNLPALHLYRSEGFTEDGVRKGYYPASGGREDAILMSRFLDD